MSYFINATIELMEKEGIENLTIRKVAEQAKYNSATLYHYFSNLDELELFASVNVWMNICRNVDTQGRGKGFSGVVSGTVALLLQTFVPETENL